jgi:hypothetical protein
MELELLFFEIKLLVMTMAGVAIDYRQLLVVIWHIALIAVIPVALTLEFKLGPSQVHIQQMLWYPAHSMRVVL